MLHDACNVSEAANAVKIQDIALCLHRNID